MIKVTEKKPGHIDITCEISGRPLDRVNENGMFCDAEVCKCKVESEKLAGSMKAFLQ